MTDQTPNPVKKIVATGDWSKGSPQQNPAPPAPIAVTPVPNNLPPALNPSLLAKAKSMAEAYASRGFLQNKRCDEQTRKIRAISCHGDETLGIAPCPFRKPSSFQEGRFYCGECGCGDRQVTWLNAPTPEEYTKLDFPKVVCPLNMPGFSNYLPTDSESDERKAKYDFSRKTQIERSVDLTIKETDAKNQ